MKSQFEQELLQTQIEIQEQTLKTISQEIHDNVGQVLSLAKLNLNTFEANPEGKLKNTKELVSKAINDLRDLSRSLHGEKIGEIGLQEAIVNELKILCERMGMDVWEVIDAAKTKPFGFQAFYPGPGLGGHCIPIDPFYLSWVARKYGMSTRFIELAGEINTKMPLYVVDPLTFVRRVRDREQSCAQRRREHTRVNHDHVRPARSLSRPRGEPRRPTDGRSGGTPRRPWVGSLRG